MIPNTKPMTNTIANKKNNHLQDKAPKMIPDKVGPIAGANMMINAVKPIMRPILYGGKTSKTIENIIGNTNPVPTPCNILPPNKSGKFIAVPLMMQPIAKHASAKIVNLRTENHFIKKLTNGNTNPITNIYPMTIHWATPVSILNSLINTGNAMFNDVSLNIPIKAPK